LEGERAQVAIEWHTLASEVAREPSVSDIELE
jgi:hypothetical protein